MECVEIFPSFKFRAKADIPLFWTSKILKSLSEPGDNARDPLILIFSFFELLSVTTIPAFKMKLEGLRILLATFLRLAFRILFKME